MAESVWATLKTEFYDRYTWPTRAEARQAVARWIEVVYNRRRLHSSLGYVPPVEFEMNLLTNPLLRYPRQPNYLSTPCGEGHTDAFTHICEVCGKTAMLTSQDAYWAGWDYPPDIGALGIISPRTCEHCPMDATVWWAITMDKRTLDDLTPEQLKTVARIRNEIPE